jgi:hypothetical protein
MTDDRMMLQKEAELKKIMTDFYTFDLTEIKKEF